jgi:hypothetical protein
LQTNKIYSFFAVFSIQGRFPVRASGNSYGNIPQQNSFNQLFGRGGTRSPRSQSHTPTATSITANNATVDAGEVSDAASIRSDRSRKWALPKTLTVGLTRNSARAKQDAKYELERFVSHLPEAQKQAARDRIKQQPIYTQWWNRITNPTTIRERDERRRRDERADASRHTQRSRSPDRRNTDRDEREYRRENRGYNNGYESPRRQEGGWFFPARPRTPVYQGVDYYRGRPFHQWSDGYTRWVD